MKAIGISTENGLLTFSRDISHITSDSDDLKKENIIQSIADYLRDEMDTQLDEIIIVDADEKDIHIHQFSDFDRDME